MTVPKLPPHDARAANNAWRTIHKADGTEYMVFASESYVAFVKGLRGQRDIVASHDLQLIDHKAHLDRLDEREASHHAAQNTRLAALEEAVAHPPFPG